MQQLVYYFIYPFLWLIAWLPLPVLYLFSDILYRVLWYIIPYRKKIILLNLQNSFPEMSAEEHNRICKAYYRHLADLMVEIIKLIHISEKEMLKRCRFENLEYLEKLYVEGRSVVAFMSHYSIWEWLPFISRIMQHKGYSIYHPMRNKYFDALFYRLRTQWGIGLFTMDNAFRGIIGIKQKKEPYLVGFISDQTPPNSKNRVWINFLNQETSVMLGAEKIAIKNNDVVVFLKTERIKRGYYVTHVVPVCENPNETKEYEITTMYYKLLENQIKEKPEYWLWSHRRWKRKRPLDEKMVKSLIQN